MADRITVGDLRRLSVAVTNVAGAPTDPTTLLLKVLKPGGTSVTTYTYGVDVIVVKDSTGNYHADVPLDTEGTWRYDWIGGGTAVFAEGSTFYCHPLLAVV